ncbi:MAG: ABC transporter ATP-binding protein [Eubacteriales bacterium]|nr:ABC transporter ATP-binding protein [Eubacteriales bacterium]MDD7550573.1 ABC transporter ATP-binding protein [Clostridia bacterium]MDY5754069.1 ABC transporter ATP-binding protein [Eubacteriales bacterium]
MKRILKFLRHHKKESILAPAFKMLEALFDLLVPLLMADIINRGIASGDDGYVLTGCGIMVLLGIIGLVCSITAQYFSAKAAVGACAVVRRSLFERIQALDFSDTDSLGTSTLITRMTSDVNQLQNGLNLLLRLLLRSPFVVFGAMVMAFIVSGKEALVFVAVIPVLSVIVFGIMLKTIPRYKTVQTKLDSITQSARENLTGVRVVRAFGREEEETREFEAKNSSLRSSQLNVGGISALLNPLTFVVINVGIIAILKLGGFEVNTGTLKAGSVIALVNYMSQILLELIKLANLIIQITKAMACAQRIDSVLEMKPSMSFGELSADDADSDIAVEFDHVSLTYTGSGEASLSDISFTAKKGQTIGIIGGTGSGKTSVVNLIPRFYDATSGTVRLFGRDIKEYDKQSIRRTVSTVMQKTLLFSGTIRSNLLWGNANATDEELWAALETAQAAEIVRSKPQGLDEPVEQGGRNFSGGQKQRLSIARSLVANPDILILDDSASALDYATDAALRAAIASLKNELTVFIVSQRANSLIHADLILVLDEGILVGKGTHEQLLATCDVYRDIYDSQFKKAGATA